MSIYKHGSGKATGKIILMGEHSVVYGKPAIAIPFFDAGISVNVVACKGPMRLTCLYHQGELINTPQEVEGLKALIGQICLKLNQPEQGFHIDIQSSLPTQRGLGSSAAVSVALIRALYNYFEQPLSQQELYDLSLVSEVINHGNPSGLDSQTISLEQAIYFERGKANNPLNLNIDGVLVIADSGRQGNTAHAIAEVKQLLAQDPLHIHQVINRLGELTDEVAQMLCSNELHACGRLLSEAQGCLKMMGVSDDGIDHLITTALHHGALGAKITGSGKGGCIIALCEDESTALHVAKSLEIEGATKTWIYHLKEMSKHEENRSSVYQHRAH